MKQTFEIEHTFDFRLNDEDILEALKSHLDDSFIKSVTEITEPEKQDKCYGEDATCKFNHTPVICESCNRYYGDSYRPKD
jgi:hypothetical protein